MANKTNAPDGFYDGHLVDASYNHTENGSGILELVFDVGENYFWAKEGIFLVNAPSGDAATDKQRKEWTIESVKRIMEVYPEAVKDGNLSIMALCNATDEIKRKTVRVKVRTDESWKFSKAKCYTSKRGKPKMSIDDVKNALATDSRALASVGVVIGEAPAASNPVVNADDANSDIPF